MVTDKVNKINEFNINDLEKENTILTSIRNKKRLTDEIKYKLEKVISDLKTNFK